MKCVQAETHLKWLSPWLARAVSLSAVPLDADPVRKELEQRCSRYWV